MSWQGTFRAMELPDSLLRAVDAERCVLFVGAGASQESNAPSSSKLARDLAMRFLAGEHAGASLGRVASLVEKKPGVGRMELIEFVVRELSGLKPSRGHALMRDIDWAAIATTNYDTLIEDSYETSPDSPQPVRVLRSADLGKTSRPDTWGSGPALVKLHGCISDPFSEGAGLVISEDDLLEAGERRKGLLSMLEWLKYTHTFVFVGYSFSDYALNRVWYDVRSELGKLSNWAFATWPNCREEEVCLWRGRYVELLNCTFSELMQELSCFVGREPRSIGGASSRDERAAATEALVSILKNADPHLYELAVRVAELARRVGMGLEMSAGEVVDLYHAALLGDIGQLSIPDSIKNKPGHLSEPEWQVMKGHPAISARILAGIPSLAHLADVVRHHHERVDGSGYPDGLSGESIPLAARIIAACGMLTMMLTPRPYRKAFSGEEALRLFLEQMGGTDLDTDVVRILTGSIRDDIGQGLHNWEGPSPVPDAA